MAESLGDTLEHDHHDIDEKLEAFAASLRTDAIDRAAFAEGATDLRHHIYVEEEFHFPPLREAGLMAPVLVMLREHGELWDLLDAIEAALERDDLAAVQAAWPQLTQVLAAHNMKEERILYPAGDKTLPPEVIERVRTELAEGATPEGWSCEMAGRG